MALRDILASMSVLISGGVSPEFGKSLTTANKQLGVFGKTAETVSSQLKGAIGAVSFGLIAKQVIDVTSNFQKFEAVLTNTLGSGSEAQKALANIKDFAAKTPFSVQELTGSFVKLANQGFKPTTNELRKLGDLSSSTGKSFDQLTEAIIDAQTGEFERLKEFGIRAQKSGDQVKFTFKGVETQTKFTADEIRKYILSLGDLEGVSGSMAAISQTLGGRISNLGDAFDNLLLTVGNLSGGPLNAIIESLTQLTKVTANLGNELELRKASYGIKRFDELSQSVGEYALATARLNGDKLVSEIIAPFDKISNTDLIANAKTNLRSFITALTREGASVEEATFLWNAYITKRVESIKADRQAEKEAFKAQIKAHQAAEKAKQDLIDNASIIQGIELSLKDLEDQKKASFSTTEIAGFNAQIEALKEQLDLLNASHPLSEASKHLTDQLPSRTLKKATRNSFTPSGLTFLSDANANTDIAGAIITKAPDAVDALDGISKAYEKSGQAAQDAATASAIALDQQIQKQQQLADTAARAGSIIGDSVGDVISGQKSVLQAVKQVTGEIIKLFLQQALAGTIAGAGKTGAPPPVIVALAAAGVAAISALFSSAVGGAGGSVSASAGGGRATTQAARFSPVGQQQDIVVTGRLVANGRELVAVIDSQNNKTGRTG